MAWQIRRRRGIYLLAGLCLLALASSPWWSRIQRSALVLAPMMDLTPCLLALPDGASGTQPDWLAPCSGPRASSAHLVESTLRHLQPKAPEQDRWKLGYTLQVPLLALLQADQAAWHVNAQAVDNIVRTVSETPRPVVLYLFSTHFGVKAPIEPVLAQDPDNIAATQQGPLPLDSYYGLPIYPWSVARTDNAITRYRVEVIQALIQKLCLLPAEARSRIQGITLLGEIHQLFPNFQSGMGFNSPFLVSDYSAASVAGFRSYLQSRYTSLQRLNQQMGSDYPAFDAIVPPGKDIRREPMAHYSEHLDAYAAGKIPVTGWVYSPDVPNTAQVVKIYLDGKHLADAPVQLSRQDVRAARPEFKTADVGWRYDLEYSQLASGIHRIDVALSQPGQELIQLGSRTVSIAYQRQQNAQVIAAAPLPPMQPLPARIAAYTDEPRDRASYFYNPLAREWQAFREAQVVRYLQFFNQLIGQSCLSSIPRYTHQIVPQFNPGWDSGRYAADASLQAMKDLQTGVSLYGETSYGRSFSDWLKKNPRAVYGVTEFHPLQAMSAQQLDELFTQHRDNGARFLSFFLETWWQDKRVSSVPNLFAFDPDNRQHASDQLFNSVKALLAQ